MAPAQVLADLTVLVTRPAGQADELVRLIESAGGRALRFPAVEIAEPADTAALKAILRGLPSFDWAIFISPNAVNKTFNLLKAQGEWPRNVRVAGIGKGSATALKHFGIANPLVPSGRFDSEGLLASPPLQDIHGKRIVIFRGDGGREALGDTLAARGAEVTYAECYRRIKPRADAGPLLRAWARGELHVVTLTSVQSLHNLFDVLGKLGQQWLLKTPTVVVSERIADACRELRFKAPVIVAENASDAAVVAAISSWRERQNAL